ncbi:MAG: SLATT domain-containing protein [Bryobacteraceae bacterium]
MSEGRPEGIVSTAGYSSPKAVQLLLKWSERARANQFQHWESARYYELANYALGGPAVVLSAIVGTAVFATLEKLLDIRIRLAVGAISVLSAILVAIQTFLRLSERAEKHRATAAAYSSVRRRIEAALSLAAEKDESLKGAVEEVLKELNSLAESAPTVPARIWRRTKADLQQHDSFLAEQFGVASEGARAPHVEAR